MDSLALSLMVMCNSWLLQGGRFCSLPSSKRASILLRSACYWCSFLIFLDAYRRLGVSRPPLVHYVAPSSWAWKGGENKLKNLADTLDHLLCILPFEAALFKAHGIKATYVGHPVLEDAFTSVAVCTSWCLSPLASVADTQNMYRLKLGCLLTTYIVWT